MLRVCVWMDVPSHYQRAFFQALDDCDDVDLAVCYTKPVSQRRIAQGWSSDYTFEAYEHSMADLQDPAKMFSAVPGGEDRIHLVCSHFSRTLVEFFCTHGVRWCHWSEMPGIRLADLLGYRMSLFRLLNPLMLVGKRNEGLRIKKYALGAFGQGRLAHRAFRMMGVPERMITDLYYVPSGLPEADACAEMLEFSDGRKIFLAVGALCRRKGVDVLLEAFAKLDADAWCLVFCGLDHAGGIYQKLAQKLGVDDRVLFLGAYPVERIAEVYGVADVFVLPSRFDGWGAVLNEASSCGLPLIGTDLCGGSWHVIKEGSNGFRVRAGSVKSLKTAMCNFVGKPSIIDEFGAFSKELFARELVPRRNAERLVKGLLAMMGNDE